MSASAASPSTRTSFIIALVLLGLCAAAIGLTTPSARTDRPDPEANPGRAADKPFTIVATTGMIADVVRGVAGNRAKVETLMGAGVDPHLYRPTRSDIARLQSADMVFYNGLLLEGKMTETFDRLGASGKPVFAVTEGLTESHLLNKALSPDGSAAPPTPGAEAAHHDPHVWMDPRLWARSVQVVQSKLTEHDPAGKEAYAAGAAKLAAELAALDEYAARALETVPEKSRVLVTAHDAFNYFGRRYSYRVEGIQGISTESEAGVRDIQRLVDLIVERGVKAVFVETSVPDRNVKALAAGAKAKGHDVVIGGWLFSDAMGEAGTYEGTYIGMIDHNVTVITRALGGQAPERGMNGKLAAPAPTSTPAPAPNKP